MMFAALRRRLTDMATLTRLFRSAEKHALAAQQQQPGAEHFVLAALDLPDGTARRAFEALGADASGLAPAIAEQHRQALAGIGIVAEISDEPALPGKAGLYVAAASGQELVQALAKRPHPNRPLRGADVLAVAAAAPHGVMARTLRSMGIDRIALAAEAQRQAG